MKISFTGIDNIYLDQSSRKVNIKLSTEPNKIYDGIESYFESDGELNDNEKSQDLRAFYEAMLQSNVVYQNINNPYEVNIKAYCHSYSVDEETTGNVFNITLNDHPVNLDEPSSKNLLPLYTFMAKLTSKLQNKEGLSEDEKICAKNINTCCHSYAVHFIDNIM